MEEYFDKNRYLAETSLMDCSAKSIRRLVEQRGWRKLGEEQKIREIYRFVRDDIRFGYNESDCIAASRVLREGYGQCNTKAILFMTLLRAVEIPCRIHGFLIDKKLQKGVMNGRMYRDAPDEVLHTWVEALCKDKWYVMEGLILDSRYLKSLQAIFPNSRGTFIGYGAAVKDLHNLQVDWNRNHTYIQKEGIVQDLGTYDSPDELLNLYRQKLGWMKGLIYRHIARRVMNRRVEQIRNHAAAFRCL